MLKIANNKIADADELKTRLIDEWAQFEVIIELLLNGGHFRHHLGFRSLTLSGKNATLFSSDVYTIF